MTDYEQPFKLHVSEDSICDVEIHPKVQLEFINESFLIQFLVNSIYLGFIDEDVDLTFFNIENKEEFHNRLLEEVNKLAEDSSEEEKEGK